MSEFAGLIGISIAFTFFWISLDSIKRKQKEAKNKW